MNLGKGYVSFTVLLFRLFYMLDVFLKIKKVWANKKKKQTASKRLQWERDENAIIPQSSVINSG